MHSIQYILGGRHSLHDTLAEGWGGGGAKYGLHTWGRQSLHDTLVGVGVHSTHYNLFVVLGVHRSLSLI